MCPGSEIARMTMIVNRGYVIKTPSGNFALDKGSARHAWRFFRMGHDTKNIAELLGVSEAAVYNGMYLHKEGPHQK